MSFDASPLYTDRWIEKVKAYLDDAVDDDVCRALSDLEPRLGFALLRLIESRQLQPESLTHAISILCRGYIRENAVFVRAIVWDHETAFATFVEEEEFLIDTCGCSEVSFIEVHNHICRLLALTDMSVASDLLRAYGTAVARKIDCSCFNHVEPGARYKFTSLSTFFAGFIDHRRLCSSNDAGGILLHRGDIDSMAKSRARFDSDEQWIMYQIGKRRRYLGCALWRKKLRRELFEVAIGLQALDLPALITLSIVDEMHDLSSFVAMHFKWDSIVAIKHFRDKSTTSDCD